MTWKNNYTLFVISSLFMFTWGACNPDDEPIPEEEQELITTLRLELKPEGKDTTLVLSFVDIDGEGGNDPVLTGATLEDSTLYSGTLTLLNESVTPVEDITAEIRTEGDAHQFFFEAIGIELGSTYADSDANGKPIGLAFTLQTFGPGSGSLQITLRHEPDKNATGVEAGNIQNAGGETDIEVRLPLQVQ
ncbi:MAG: type 1 periplasmic binding fold superfamily protein [Flavobacteriales bacterium]|nr:type 1 periplasmic binding fold superfamily protein [Flavobacteriales bacterium]